MTFRPLQALRALVRPGGIEGLSASERLVMMALTSYADEDGRCWPSLSTVAGGTGLCRATVAASLARLDTMGFVERVQRPRPQTTMYRITLPLSDSPGGGLVQEVDYPNGGQVVQEMDPDSPGDGPRSTHGRETTPNGTPAAEAVERFCGAVGTEWELRRDTPESWVARMQEEHPGVDVEARVERATEWWDSALSTGKRKKCKAPSQALRAFLRDPPSGNGRPAQASAPDAGVTYRRLR